MGTNGKCINFHALSPTQKGSFSIIVLFNCRNLVWLHIYIERFLSLPLMEIRMLPGSDKICFIFKLSYNAKFHMQISEFNVFIATFHHLLCFLNKLELKHVVHSITIAKADDVKTLYAPNRCVVW